MSYRSVLRKPNKHWHEKSSQGREHTDSICDLCRSQVVRRPDPAQEAAAQQWTDPAQDRDLPQLLSLAGAAASRRHAQDGTTKTHARFSANLWRIVALVP